MEEEDTNNGNMEDENERKLKKSTDKNQEIMSHVSASNRKTKLIGLQDRIYEFDLLT